MTDPKIGERLADISRKIDRNGFAWFDDAKWLVEHLNELRRLAQAYDRAVTAQTITVQGIVGDINRYTEAREALRRYLEELNGND